MRKIEKIPSILEKELPFIIKKIAKNYNKLPYIDNPDFLEERLSPWHQFGLLGHSKKVRESFLNELDNILTDWGVYPKVYNILNLKIDNIKRKILLEISIPLHDLGKILVHGDKRTDRSHESLSKYLVSQDFLRKKLENLDLSEEHIKYIRRCIETHYILGRKARDELKYEGNLRLDYISEKNIGKICRDLSEEYSDIKIELGVFFLCDLLGKTDIRINAKTDLDISEQETDIKQILKERNLHPELKKAVMQLPINMKLAEVYLKNITRT